MADLAADHSANQAALVLNVAARSIRRLATDGVLSRSAHGKYPFPAYVQEYIGYVEHGHVAGTVAAAEMRLKEEQTRKLKLHNDYTAGTLVKRDAIEQGASAAQIELNAELDGLPGRCCVEFAAQQDAAIIRHRLREEIINVRNSFATRLTSLAARARAGRAEGKVPHTGRMGQRKSSVAARKRRAGTVSK
jgi:hypothetical protein